MATEPPQPHAREYPGTLHLGCGEDSRDGAHNVDQLAHDGVDEVVDLDRAPWPWPDDTFSRIEAHHVFEHLTDMETALRESARVLAPGGVLCLTLPVGQNAWADPDHEHRWNWDTPEMFCGARPWDADVGLEVIEKGATVGSHMPGTAGVAYGGLLRLLSLRYGPGRWLFDLPATSGEFTVVFEKPHDSE